jgi:hypothetical protein
MLDGRVTASQGALRYLRVLHDSDRPFGPNFDDV